MTDDHGPANPGLPRPRTGFSETAFGPEPASTPPKRAGSPGFPRSVRPEILDGLPEDAPAARASRRDLRIINRLLGNGPWLKRALRAHLRPGEPVLEIGAGTGELGRALQALAPDFAGLDLGRRPGNWPPPARWFQTDARAFTQWADYPVVIANLFFHHFDDAGLADLGRQLGPHARIIIASDPLRARRTAVLFGLLGPLIRAHPVTRYDGCVSIAAGFRGDELAHRLHLDPAAWNWRAEETRLGSSRLIATRRT